MTLPNLIGRTGRGLALGAASLAAVGLTAALPQPAHAISPGAAVGIGLGALALGTAFGAAPYYGYPYYGYGYGYPYYGYPGYAYNPPGYGCDPYWGCY